MKHRTVVCAAALFLGIVLALPAWADSWGGTVSVLVGQKMLGADWNPLDSQTEFGIQSSFGAESWPVQIAVDYIQSNDSADVLGLSVDGRTTELDLGVRKFWGSEGMRPFVGGGVALINAEIETLGIGADGDAVGLWVDGGVLWILESGLTLGLGSRYSAAEVDILEIPIESGGFHLAASVGWSW